MLGKIFSFFTGFLGNAKKDPVSTIKGLGQVAIAGVTTYAIATGKIPVDEVSVGFASATALSGLHAIGSNTTGTTEIEKTVVQAANTTMVVVGVVDQVQQLKKEAEEAKLIVDNYKNLEATLSQFIPPNRAQ